ncbi:DUF2267 domain-containing protein [uncultured Roseicyclus sp.]|jgi:uncharacterized protein (DUF2267 family)|uniref:DUF2267 domain-containing protein n=1 Tax=uncultured Roseicyclus sp. TaxID=543072 RepID=UPI0026126DF1|nr:DUF2267 domain-containing protein [uncultured Roseicyclus sp.]
MSALGLKIIDESVQQANIWINEVDYRVGLVNKQRAYRLLRAVLQALRDQLSPDEAAQLSAQLPIFVRGIFYEGYDPSRTPAAIRSKADFLARVLAIFGPEPPEDIEAAIGSVFDVLDARVSEGEMAQVRGCLTRDVQALFDD